MPTSKGDDHYIELPPETVEVEIPSIDMTEIPGFRDASTEDEPVPLPGNFKDLLRKRLGQTQPGQTIDCNSFLSQVITKAVDITNRDRAAARRRSPGSWGGPDLVAYAEDGLDLVDKVSKFTLASTGVRFENGWGAGGTVRGSIKDGTAEVIMPQGHIFTPPPSRTRQLDMVMDEYIHTAIHELVHLSSGAAGDGRLAQAAFELGFSTVQVDKPDSPDMKDIFAYSDAWDKALAKYCGARFRTQL